MPIIEREAWGAREPRHRNWIAEPTDELWLHHTAGALDANGNGVYDDDCRAIQDFHMDVRDWSDIAYSFLTAINGVSFEGRGAMVVGGHTRGRNSKSHGLCAIGNFEVQRPTPELLEELANLVVHGLIKGWWRTDITGPHKEAPGASTACCGKYLIREIPNINARAAEIWDELMNGTQKEEPPEMAITEEEIRAAYRKFALREPDEDGVEFWLSVAPRKEQFQLHLLAEEGLPRMQAELAEIKALLQRIDVRTQNDTAGADVVIARLIERLQD